MTGLRAGQPMNCDPMSVKDMRFFSSAKHVAPPPALVPTPAFYSMGTGVLSPGLRWSGLEADHSSSFTVEVQNEYNCTSTSLHAFVVCTKINLLFTTEYSACLLRSLSAVRNSLYFPEIYFAVK